MFEPMAGILSANLPITYVLFANSFRKLADNISSTFGSSKPLARFSQGWSNKMGSGRSNKMSSGRDDSKERWIQLDPKASWSTDSKPLAGDAE